MDFRVVDVPGMLGVQVRSFGEDGNEMPDDGEWYRHSSTAQFVFAELLVAKGLVPGKSSIVRSPDLVIDWSELSDVGQSFVKAAYDEWLRSVDNVTTTEATMMRKLEKRWQKFVAQQSAA